MRDARVDHQVEAVPEAERDALEHRPGEVRSAMGEREPHKRATGIRIRVRRALAGEVRQEHEALGTRRDRRGLLDQRAERLAGRDRVAIPAQRAGGRQHHRHQMPASGRRVAERVDATLGLVERAIGRGEDHARRAQAQGDDPRVHRAPRRRHSRSGRRRRP